MTEKKLSKNFVFRGASFRVAIHGMLLWMAIGVAPPAFGEEQETVTVKTNRREDFIKAVQGARPGTTILLAPGTYRGGVSFKNLRGKPGRPIVIAAEDPERPPIFNGGTSGLHLIGPAHIELRDLAFEGATGNGVNIDDGGSSDAPSGHIILKKLRIRNVGPRGNKDGLKLSGLVDFRVENCTIERWGDGGSAIDMVGCRRGVVETSIFRHEGPEGANGVQVKGGSRDIVVRRCRFENVGGRSVNIGGHTGEPYFRPRVQGYEARDITVEDNTFIASAAPICFVGVDGATVQFNTIYRPARWVMRILQENRGENFVKCRKGRFANNVIAYRSGELRTVVNVGHGTAPESFSFSKNYWFCIDRPASSERVRRMLPSSETGGTYGTDPLFRDPERGDLRLKGSSPVRDAGPRRKNERRGSVPGKR